MTEGTDDRRRPGTGTAGMAAGVMLGATLALAVGTLALAPAAEAYDKSQRYGVATAPFQDVGTMDKALSSLCRRNMFNQRKKVNLYIGYVGENNSGRHTMTGIAKQNWNLYDPTRASEPNVTYHFFNDGYSNCQVFVAREGDQKNVRD